jgi:hypothetical protein
MIMKTTATFILTAILLMLLSNTTISGFFTPMPLPDYSFSADADSLVAVRKPVALKIHEEEQYVNDIPFDTKAISTRYIVSLTPANEQESYVNDIPFDTETIAIRFLPARNYGIDNEPEQYVDDIPFSTERIAERYLIGEFSKYCCKAL